jgi:hypothetical protein
MPYDPKEWRAANKDKQRLYSARYRLRKKGLDLPPETLAELEAIRAKKKAESAERLKESKRRWNREHKDQRSARTKERYANDPEFRERTLELARARRAKNKPELTDEQKATRLRQRREAQVKAVRASAAKAAQRRAEMGEQTAPKRPAPKPDVLTEAQKAAPKWKIKKPGRLIALCGWNGW